ncbi:MAG TPA: protealysin inhibitor emfourin [Cyclobacteriaceae bacterium]|nr:protealysin inhibitor emfourin [Cyclobacteriaceae bacterium]
MKLKLIQTGGFAGLTRSAEIDVEQEEADALLQRLALPDASQQPPSEMRDAFNHILIIGDKRIPFSPEDAPTELKPTIDRLLSQLA